MTSDLEARTQHFGHALFAAARTDQPLPLTPRWLDERMMAWTMNDEAVKIQLFRLVDVLPMLKSSSEVTRHLREYFEEAEAHLSPVLRLGVHQIPRDGLSGWLVASAARFNAERLARRFIAGTDLAGALQAVSVLRSRSMAFSIDLLGEAVLTAEEATQYQQSYLRLVQGLANEVNRWPPVDLIDRDSSGPLPRVNVSVKLSSLYSQFDPIDPAGTSNAVIERLRPILRAARSHGAFVNVDMEQYAYKDLTFQIFRKILNEVEFRDWPDVGIAVQAYLRSCGDDLRSLARWVESRGTPVWVRLVKGAYWDYENIVTAQEGWPLPVFAEKWETDANFEVQTRFLLEHHTLLRPAIGTHNIRSMAYALSLAEQLGLPPRRLEFQLLYGMGDPIKAALVRMGQRVRVYCPCGQLLPGMAYLVRRLLENTANESFLRAGFLEHVPEERLLMNPVEIGKRCLARPSIHESEAGEPAAFANEPLSDFSRESARQAMQAALSDVTSRLGGEFPLVIGDREIRPKAMIESVNPSHQRQVVGRCARATVEHAGQAVAAAREAFPNWRDTPVEKRAEYLRRAAEILRRRRFELAAWEVCECAKQWREADADVAEAIDYCEYYAREMLQLARPRRRDLPGEQNEYLYEPRGVAVIIAPWNFPMAILCGMTTAAIVSGNTAIMKPAEQSPVVAAKLMEVFREAGLPPGVVNYLPGVGEEIGPFLVSHRDVELIAFTGSRAVGLAIQKTAAETPTGQDHVKRVITEMGGKNAVIVDDDADLDDAIHGVIASAFGYAGQKCSACSRAIVLEGIYDTFLNRLVATARSLKVGPAEDPGCLVGPVIDEEARRRILGFVEKGKQEARLVYAADIGPAAGGTDEGFYVGPHIFADVPSTSAIAQEEIFGPVLAVMKARDLTHALTIANSTPYALTGGVYSRSPANIARVRREFRVGNLYINRKITGALADRQPFGGFKLSGIGSKAGGPDYLLQFVVPRTITENTMRHGFAPTAPPSESAETPG
jgi:RHH-type proline utilization regulon transcriptional repressor/proline dehydrogenase/delta 1-pyrroline-5-carboxylate dehydrogenase